MPVGFFCGLRWENGKNVQNSGVYPLDSMVGWTYNETI